MHYHQCKIFAKYAASLVFFFLSYWICWCFVAAVVVGGGGAAAPPPQLPPSSPNRTRIGPLVVALLMSCLPAENAWGFSWIELFSLFFLTFGALAPPFPPLSDCYSFFFVFFFLFSPAKARALVCVCVWFGLPVCWFGDAVWCGVWSVLFRVLEALSRGWYCSVSVCVCVSGWECMCVCLNCGRRFWPLYRLCCSPPKSTHKMQD